MGTAITEDITNDTDVGINSICDYVNLLQELLTDHELVLDEIIVSTAHVNS